jgi:predicted MFS family arabinose efflux permease
MGLIGAAFGLGMVIGPAMGGGLSLLGPRVPECFAAALCLANVAIAACRLPESLPSTSRRRRGFRHPLALSSAARALARPGWRQALRGVLLRHARLRRSRGDLLARGRPPLRVRRDARRRALVYMGVGVVVQGWLVGRLARRVPERTLVVAGTLALALGFAWIPFTGAIAGLLAALALVVGGQGLASPSLASLISRTVEGPEHGEASACRSRSRRGRVCSAGGGGFVFDHFDVRARSSWQPRPPRGRWC